MNSCVYPFGLRVVDSFYKTAPIRLPVGPDSLPVPASYFFDSLSGNSS
jgi:hypothetical protein